MDHKIASAEAPPSNFLPQTVRLGLATGVAVAVGKATNYTVGESLSWWGRFWATWAAMALAWVVGLLIIRVWERHRKHS